MLLKVLCHVCFYDKGRFEGSLNCLNKLFLSKLRFSIKVVHKYHPAVSYIQFSVSNL